MAPKGRPEPASTLGEEVAEEMEEGLDMVENVSDLDERGRVGLGRGEPMGGGGGGGGGGAAVPKGAEFDVGGGADGGVPASTITEGVSETLPRSAGEEDLGAWLTLVAFSCIVIFSSLRL